jgi:dolichol-phosphate mannosyltransferase
VTVVLPAYNEAGNVVPLVTELMRVAAESRIDLHVLVVDDGSTDNTRAELLCLERRYERLQVIEHGTNRGLATALKTGIAGACANGCDAAVFMDCDLSHQPSELPRFVDALTGGGDVVLGSRFVPGGSMEGVPFWRVAISRAGNIFGRAVLGVPFRDLTTGYRAMHRRVLEAVSLGTDGFTIQLESVIKAAAAGFRIVEVPITLRTRVHGESHMRYSPALMRDYWVLLLACRRWLRGSQN